MLFCYTVYYYRQGLFNIIQPAVTNISTTLFEMSITSLSNEECFLGTWGLHCAGKCGECLNGACNVVDGRCPGRCKPGYTAASHCKEGTVRFLYHGISF